jgi:glycosyltransferase involved in cell wall biosynthesis
MKLRTLLLATYHFPPSAASGSFRLLGFARHLPAFGWRTVVVAPPRLPFEPVDDELGRKVPPGTAVYSVPFPRGNRLTRRLAPFAAWLPTAMEACNRAISAERPDALLTSSPPHTIHLLGRLLKARYGLPWIVDYRDPWIHGLGKPLPCTWLRRFEAVKENMVLSAADGIIVNTPLARAALLRDIPGVAGKTTSITNGFDPENFILAERHSDDAPSISILHTGELYSGRDPRPLLDALLNMSALTKSVRVTFLGQSSDPRYDWAGEIRRRGLEKVVQFDGHVPYHEALRRMQAADILLLLDACERRVGIPAKLFEYFGARRPILALAEPDGDVDWALRKSGVRHRLAPPSEPGRIRQALTELVAEVTARGAALPEPLSREFTRSHMAAQLAGFLDQLALRRRAGSLAYTRAPEHVPSEGSEGNECVAALATS